MGLLFVRVCLCVFERVLTRVPLTREEREEGEEKKEERNEENRITAHREGQGVSGPPPTRLSDQKRLLTGLYGGSPNRRGTARCSGSGVFRADSP